ncbi:hypothetical protein CP488_02449 [Chthonomonas calidirosea]|nr:hypothetical protein CP488_02449 [Chthonomonas calidirosea]
MGVIEFVQNYDDLSTDQGFQFRFYCDHCRNGFMSTFEPNKLGLMGDALRAAGGFLGGFLSRAGEQPTISSAPWAARRTMPRCKQLFKRSNRSLTSADVVADGFAKRSAGMKLVGFASSAPP